MNTPSFSRMPLSPKAAWSELAKVASMIARVFWFLVVPLSLLPPAMLYLAGSQYGDVFFAALILSCGLIFQGVRFFCHISEVEDLAQAAEITRIVS